MSSIDRDWGVAMGIPPGRPTPRPMWSISVVRGCASLNVTRRPAPADSKPSGIDAGGEGWIVDRVWGIWVLADVAVGMASGCGYVGAE